MPFKKEIKFMEVFPSFTLVLAEKAERENHISQYFGFYKIIQETTFFYQM